MFCTLLGWGQIVSSKNIGEMGNEGVGYRCDLSVFTLVTFLAVVGKELQGRSSLAVI